ncbi:hypothetical protein HY311_02410 [Candidatus Nomurabacteria bacterium]|nr:hypothetical protein [Candidatus Nomurabacteria bacterium]
MSNFQLVGWDNPMGDDFFPAPIIPILRHDGQLVAYYPGGQKHEDPVHEDSVFVHFTTEELQGPFLGFNPEEERLFADSKTKIVRMSIEEYNATAQKRTRV